MKNKNIKVLVVKPEQAPTIAEYENRLETWQQLVGGYIELFYPFEDDVAILCNDEGKIDGMPLNRAVKDANGEILDIIAGTFPVVGLDNEDGFRSLTNAELEMYAKLYAVPEVFVGMNGRIVAVPLS